MGSKIALDSNIFIYAIENNEQLGDLARAFFEKIAVEKPQIVTSVLTIQEILVPTYREHLEEKIPTYLEFVTGGGANLVVDYTKPIALLAAQIRGDFPKVRTPDAIQIATAQFMECTEFITADKRLPQKIGKLKIKTLA